MPNHFDERWEGPIRGLRLPLSIWNRLMHEGFTTIDQLWATADQLEKLDGIGPKGARIIREELARASAPAGNGRAGSQIGQRTNRSPKG